MLLETCANRREGRRQGGFTLIEVTLAGFVLSVAILGMLSLVTVGHGVSREAWETTIAKRAVQEKLEEIKELAGRDFAAVATTYQGAGANFDVPELKPPGGGDSGLPKGTVSVTQAVAGDPNLLDVEVEVRWWGIGGDRNLSYRTRLSPF